LSNAILVIDEKRYGPQPAGQRRPALDPPSGGCLALARWLAWCFRSGQPAHRLKAKTVFTWGSIPHFELYRASSLQVQAGLQLLTVVPGSGKIRWITCTVRLASVVKSMSSVPYPGRGVRRAGAFALTPPGYAQPIPARHLPTNGCHNRLLVGSGFVSTASHPNRTRTRRRGSCTPHLTRPSAPSPG